MKLTEEQEDRLWVEFDNRIYEYHLMEYHESTLIDSLIRSVKKVLDETAEEN